MVKILYFGRLSDRAQKREDTLVLPPHVHTVKELKIWLDTYHKLEGALTDPSLKIMVDQKLVHENVSITSASEIGFLPPVGGG